MKELGGGAILDFGSYGADILLWIFQEYPQGIKASGSLNDDGVDTDVEAEFNFSKNRKATLKLSINNVLTNDIKIVGRSRSMQVINSHLYTKLDNSGLFKALNVNLSKKNSLTHSTSP